MITSETNIIGASSPYYIIAERTTQDWNSVEVRLYVWQGEVDDKPSTPTNVLKKSKLMTSDKRLEFEIRDYLIDYLEPQIDPFNYQSNFGVSATFFMYEVDYLSTTESIIVRETYLSPLKLATLGWRYSYELNPDTLQYVDGAYMANGTYSLKFADNNEDYKVDVEYPQEMSNYMFSFKKNFPITDSNEAFLITPFTSQPDKIVCKNDAYGIAFINKTGVWDILPLTGRTQETTDVSSDTYNRGYRSNFNYNPQYQNSKMNINTTEKSSFTLNTGALTEQLSAYYEEIMYSPRLILVDYYRQISYPCSIRSNTFTRKTKFVDKNKINHTFTFEADNNVIKKW